LATLVCFFTSKLNFNQIQYLVKYTSDFVFHRRHSVKPLSPPWWGRNSLSSRSRPTRKGPTYFASSWRTK